MIGRIFLVWCGLLVVAVLNGAFREGVLVPRFGTATAHVISTLMLSAEILILTYLTLRWLGPKTSTDALVIGMIWVALTLIFEFGFGRYRGRSWSELLADYNILRGRIWVLVLLTTALAPLLLRKAVYR